MNDISCWFCSKHLINQTGCYHSEYQYCIRLDKYISCILKYCAVSFYFKSKTFDLFIRKNSKIQWKNIEKTAEQKLWTKEEWFEYIKNYDLM